MLKGQRRVEVTHWLWGWRKDKKQVLQVSSAAEKDTLKARSGSLTRGTSWALISFDGQHGKLVTKQPDLGGRGGWVTYLDWVLKYLKERVWHVWPEEEHMGILKGFCVGRVTPAIVCLYACFVFNLFWCLSLFGQNVAWPLSTNILAFVIIGDTFCLYNSHMKNLAFAFWIFFSFFLYSSLLSHLSTLCTNSQTEKLEIYA